jgi:pantoate--beta-alanine ligase
MKAFSRERGAAGATIGLVPTMGCLHKTVIAKVIETIGKEPLARIDYVEIVSLDDFAPLERIEGEALIALAVFVGKTRLIDNIRISSRG